MGTRVQRPVGRRGVIAGGAALLGGVVLRQGAAAQDQLYAASGNGVNLKMMLDADGQPTVPLRELFGFDSFYAQCVIEDNPERFAMDTFEMGKVVVEPHTFFMAMYANDISLVSVQDMGNGAKMAKLTGDLGCLTEVGTATGKVGSREASEPAFFEVEAVDGGHGGGTVGDTFKFTVYFDPKQAPVNHGIFGPKPTFTGEMIAGEVTIEPVSGKPLLAPSATPSP